MLNSLFANELPDFITKNKGKSETQVIAPKDTITRFMQSLDFYFQNPSLVNDDLLELKTKELILLLIQTQNIESITDLLLGLYSSRTTDLKRTIELHLQSNLSVEELAKLCNLSLSSFKREFKKRYNDSPANYIITSKLRKGKELLLLSDIPVSEIAYQIGFNDPLYFSRLFKNRFGCSPTIYRKSHK